MVKGSVVRAKLILPGQPITKTAIVKGDASGFMAATLGEGMRGISIAISTDFGAGGFILPNDRVDVIVTRQPREQQSARHRQDHPHLICACSRWTRPSSQEKDTRTVMGKTATVEVTPEQAEIISAAGTAGQLSLSLAPARATPTMPRPAMPPASIASPASTARFP